MSITRTYNFLFLMVLAGYLYGCGDSNGGKPKMPRMDPKFMYHDKGPMGTNIAYRLVPQQFDGDVVFVSKALKGSVNPFVYAKNTVYLSIGKDMELREGELEQLLNYVAAGNEYFIASNGIDSRLLDTLGVKRNYYYDAFDTVIHKTNTSLRILDPAVSGGVKRYGFFYYPFKSIYSSYDSSTTRSLGITENGYCNYLVVRYGNGRFYFHAAPTAFTNYFLLTNDNVNYYSQVFSYLNKNATIVYWDDGRASGFGKKQDDFSALAMFWKNPPLRYAMLLACLLLLLYIAFESKRRRRLVPVRVPNTNASLSFVQTISNLYRQKKDNRNIAVKMMTYFFEHVRSKYFLNTSTINTEFVQALSRKSGVPESSVQELMDKAAYINEAADITDKELFEINNLIYEFYKS